MKILGPVRTGVQSLALEQSGVEAELAKGAAIAQATGAIGAMVSDYEQQKIDNELREASLGMASAENDFAIDSAGRDVYSSSEVPEGIEIRRTNKEVIGNEIVENERVDIPAYEVSAEIYRDKMKKQALAQASKIANERERNLWLEDTNQRIDARYAARKEQSLKEQKVYTAKKLETEITAAVDSGRYNDALLLADDIKDQKVKSETKRAIKFQRENNEYDQLALVANDPQSWQEIDKAVEELRDPDKKSNLTFAQRDSKAKKLESAKMQGQAQIRAEQEKAVNEQVSNVKIALNAGSTNFDESDIDNMYDRNMITAAERTSMTGKVIKNREAGIKAQQDIDMISSIRASGGVIDPTNKDMRKAVNTIFEQDAAASGDVWQSALNVAKNYGVLPDKVQSLFAAANRSGGESLASAASLYAEMQDISPLALGDLKDVDRVQTVASYMQLGMKAGEAIDTLNRIEAMTDAQKQTVKQMFDERPEREDNADALTTLFNEKFDPPLWFNTPDMPMHMTSEFESLVRLALPSTGYDLKAAQQKAFNQVSTKYTFTDINGTNQVMPYMPQQPSEYVRAQIKEQLGDGVTIQSDQFTIIEKRNKMPLTYQAWRKNKDGTTENLGRYNYDPESINAKMEKDRKAEKESQLMKGIQMQENIKRAKVREEEIKQLLGREDVVRL